MTKSSMGKVTKMSMPAAARIYSATAVKGSGSVPKDSFGARAMSSAMRTAPVGEKSESAKSK
jgi:hypothetical protein